MYKSFQCEGLNWVVADGEVAGQEIFHVHLHLVPRYTNGADSISQVEQQDYDLVLLDLRMPAKRGFEVLSEIRPNHPNTRIVMVSECVSTEFANIDLRLGADSYVAKPYSMGYLAEGVQYAQELRASANNRINRRELLTAAVA